MEILVIIFIYNTDAPVDLSIRFIINYLTDI